MPGMGPAPGGGSLADLTDVDVQAGDGLTGLSKLTYDNDSQSWIPLLDTLLDAQQSTSPVDEWTDILVATTGEEARGAGAAVYDGKLWYLGGSNLNVVCSVDLSQGEPVWTEGATHVTGSGAVDFSGFHFVTDGTVLYAWFNKSSTDLAFVRIADEDTLVAKSLPADVLSAAPMAMIGSRIHRIGNDKFNAAVHHVYDTLTDTWTQLAAPPTSAFPGFVTAYRGKLYVFGSTTNPLAVNVYDPATDSWSAGTDAPATVDGISGLRNAEGTIYGSLIYVVGGVDHGSRAEQPIHRYSPALDAWDEITSPKGASAPTTDPLTIGTLGGRIATFGGPSGFRSLHVYG